MSELASRCNLRLRGLLVFAFIALLWVWMALPWLSGDVTIPYDAKAHFQAQIQFLANALHRGDSPFWTPNIFGGSPQIADPQSLIFSPAILLALFDKAPSFRSMDTYVLVLLLIGGLAVAQFGRERGWHPAAQVAAALVFAFGASASWRLQHVGQVQSLACFAVLFWLLARALERASWRSGLAAGAAAGVMVVTPDQVDFLGLYVLAGYTVWFVLKGREPWVVLRRVWRALLAGGVVGLAIITVPLLMTLLFSAVSNRAEIDYGEAARGSLHPAFLLTAFIGDLFGAADPKVDFWGPSSAAWAPGSLTLSQNMGQVYVGALPLLAVIFWLAGGIRRVSAEARFVLGALLAMIIYAVGAYTPLFPLIFHWLPGADMFRRPADATFMIGALMALLTGFAVNTILSESSPSASLRPLAITVALTGSAFAAALAIAFALGRLGLAWPAIVIGAAWLSSALVLLGLLTRLDRERVAARPILALLVAGIGLHVAADIRVNNGPNESTAMSSERFAVMEPNTDNDTIAYLKAVLARGHREPARRDRVELLVSDFHWPNLGMIHGFDTAFGYNPLHLAQFTEATGARDHMGSALERTFTPMFPSFRSTFADMLGLRFIISAIPVEHVDRSLKPGDVTLLARTADGYIYENPRALPRAMVVPAARQADFASLLDEGLPADFDPRKVVLLEKPGEDTILAPAAGEGAAKTQVRLASYANTEIVVEVEAATAGYLVLNDVWHPWWRATVNNEEADILKANVLFRAVQIEAGRSTIRFSFRPLDGAIAELREKVLGPEAESETAESETPSLKPVSMVR
ncbi:MAG: hypothetical protein NT037_12455 [Hyphomicrobiales bacterium]|nr:hypothetical protein [Hyphomicrobiales bacterium]